MKPESNFLMFVLGINQFERSSTSFPLSLKSYPYHLLITTICRQQLRSDKHRVPRVPDEDFFHVFRLHARRRRPFRVLPVALDQGSARVQMRSSGRQKPSERVPIRVEQGGTAVVSITWKGELPDLAVRHRWLPRNHRSHHSVVLVLLDCEDKEEERSRSEQTTERVRYGEQEQQWKRQEVPCYGVGDAVEWEEIHGRWHLQGRRRLLSTDEVSSSVDQSERLL